MPRRNAVVRAEQEAMEESEASLEVGTDQSIDEQQVEAALVEAGADATAALPAEAAAVHSDTDTAVEANQANETPVRKQRPAKSAPQSARTKQRSVRYRAARAKLTGAGPVELERAIALVKATSYSRFDGTVELHIRLLSKKKEGVDAVRGLVTLPSGAANPVNAVVLTEALIAKIAATKRADADLYLATPSLMPKVASVARILGPQGKMPNPKTGTVTDHPDATMRQIQAGRIEYRADSEANVHVGIGKVSWTSEQIQANVHAILSAIGTNRLRSLSLTSTMGPGIAVDLATIG